MSRQNRTARFPKWLLLLCVPLLASCGPQKPDADDWRLGAHAQGVVIEPALPAELTKDPKDPVGPVMGRPVYLITEQALYFPVARSLQQRVYRYDIPARAGRWQEEMPEQSTARRSAFQTGRLLGKSDMLRQRERAPEPEVQPFNGIKIRLEQSEMAYSHTYYNIGFPFGKWGWVTREYGDGTLKLYAGTDSSEPTVLLSQSYHADNYPFIAGWTPDGRYVVVLEMLESASYYRKKKGHAPSLRFAVFGPYPVERTEAEILAFHTRADEKERQRQLDRKLRQGLIGPEERYGAMYEELIVRIKSCSALLTITGPVETLALDPDQTLGLSGNTGDEAGKYFTFELQTDRGNGRLQAAAFYPQTPEQIRREIISKIARYDLSFNGKQHYFDVCQAR